MLSAAAAAASVLRRSIWKQTPPSPSRHIKGGGCGGWVASGAAARLLSVLLLALWPFYVRWASSLSCHLAHRGRDVRGGTSSAATNDGAGEQFIYVYDLPRRFHADLLLRRPRWHSAQYDVEQYVHALLDRSNAVRTTDPERATLFFLPIYAAYHIDLICNTKVGEDVNMHEAVAATGGLISDALQLVQEEHPYFRRRNGRDHFLVTSHDHGRCSALTFVDPKLYGELFTLQLSGDQRTSSRMGHPQLGIRYIAYNPRSQYSNVKVPHVPCYIPGHDIVVPAMTNLEISEPEWNQRAIDLVGRFGKEFEGMATMHHGHSVRREIYDVWRERQIVGWSLRKATDDGTVSDMKHAKFCACPPSLSQWTSHLAKAVLLGCIPVLFSSDHDQPWEDEIDYHSFSIMIRPSEVATLPDRIDTVLKDEFRYKAMKEALRSVQHRFLYNQAADRGVHVYILQELQKRAKLLRSGRDHSAWKLRRQHKKLKIRQRR